MSRYQFSRLFASVNGMLPDVHGEDRLVDSLTGRTTFPGWRASAVFGWDFEGYFLHGPDVYDEESDRDCPSFLYVGIPSPYMLIALVNRIFGDDDYEFTITPNEAMLLSLKKDRASNVGSLGDFLISDGLWEGFLAGDAADGISEEYLRAGIKIPV